MKIWLDDERDPKNDVIQMNFGANGDEIWVKTVDEVISLLRTNKIKSISLDHDLGLDTGTGADVANWIEQEAFYGNLNKLEWYVHSMNPIGKENITRALRNADKYWQRNETA